MKLPDTLRDLYPFAAPPGHEASGEGWEELRSLGSVVGDRKAISPSAHAAWMRGVMAALDRVEIKVKR